MPEQAPSGHASWEGVCQMPVVFGLGLRHGGADNLAWLFRRDGRFTCWEEPLGPMPPRPRSGGDLAEPLRAARDRLVFQSAGTLRDADFDCGVPGVTAADELSPHWPDHARELVRDLTTSADQVLVTLTRASHKLPELAVLAPDAHVLQVVDDPRRFATRHVGGCDSFFSEPHCTAPSAVEALADHLIATRIELADMTNAPAYVKCLLVWRELTRHVLEDAPRRFPGRHTVIWAPVLVERPDAALRAIYAIWGGPQRAFGFNLRRWRARTSPPPVEPWHAPANAMWESAFDALELTPVLDAVRAHSAEPDAT